ncbi:MAG: hypothetical protein B7X04_00515 [Parcubacteria group bacterium 21-54-25]|nr:MAG: hypothetical protein B7X04_00515 [Parcubacteria group bacterium 21-54-25]
MADVHYVYVFGRRQTQCSDGSGETDPLVFTISVTKKPTSWQAAYALLGFFREDFIRACIAANTSSWLYLLLPPNHFGPLVDEEVWIPTGYLDEPTIEIDNEELLLDGSAPNPWLSLISTRA